MSQINENVTFGLYDLKLNRSRHFWISFKNGGLFNLDLRHFILENYIAGDIEV